MALTALALSRYLSGDTIGGSETLTNSTESLNSESTRGFVFPNISYVTREHVFLDVAESLASEQPNDARQFCLVESAMILGLVSMLRGDNGELSKHYESPTPHAGIFFCCVSVDRKLG